VLMASFWPGTGSGRGARLRRLRTEHRPSRCELLAPRSFVVVGAGRLSGGSLPGSFPADRVAVLVCCTHLCRLRPRRQPDHGSATWQVNSV